MSDYPNNPVLFEYRRGGKVESVHRGAYVILRKGKLLASAGEIDHPYFWRSASKPFQALPLIESGAADRYGLTNKELSLISASHNGEDCHRDAAASILRKGGLEEKDLRCGSHAPFDGETAAKLRAAGEKASALRHNCSGKHAGMLLLAKFLGQDPASYLEPEGEAQRRILAALSEICQWPARDCFQATDGCSAPTFAVPLRQLALGYARFSNPEGLSSPRQDACRKLWKAIGLEPYLFAGRKQLDTDLVQATGGRMVGKRGAEGVYAIGIAEKETGIALKIDDGSNRMHPFFLLSLLRKHGMLEEKEIKSLASSLDPVQRNFAGLDVGDMAAVFS